MVIENIGNNTRIATHGSIKTPHKTLHLRLPVNIGIQLAMCVYPNLYSGRIFAS
jgi:hypothetical protein